MAILALAGTLAFSFLLELIGASAANSSGWGIVGAIAAMGAFLICVPIRGCGGLCGIGGRRGWR